jgi:hypothetical protein
MRSAVALLVALSGLGLACSDAKKEDAVPIPLPSSSASSRPVASVVTTPASFGSCVVEADPERFCVEFGDAETRSEWASHCKGTMVDAPCKRQDVIASCRLPDGALRVGYPPRPASLYERQCKESQGDYFAGTVPGPEHAITITSCAGKYDEACEEEEVHAKARLLVAEDECTSFKGTFQRGKGCPTDGLLARCDLPGKRTLLVTGPANPDARARFCSQKKGKLEELAPAASASAPVAPDPDPPPEKAEIDVRRK